MSKSRSLSYFRRAAVSQMVREGVPPMGAKASFDAMIRRELAKAWQEGYDATHEWYKTYEDTLYTAPENPYRKDEE